LLDVRLSQSSPVQLDVRLECQPGETLALVGPSGSGKSTILKAIAGLNRGAGGRVTVAGETWLDTAAGVNWPARRRRTGFVFQSYALFPHLSAFENVLEAIPPGPRPRRERRAAELLTAVNLDGFAARRPGRLSGGQQQRVALARALARDPGVLLLDEPFSAVDQVTRERLYEELASLRQQLTIPVVLVTHSLQEAAMLADRMTVLHQGVTLQSGTPQEVMTRPVSREVARLVAIKNIFEGTIAAHDLAAERSVLDWQGLALELPLQPQLALGAACSWVIPPSHVIIHRRDKPSTSARGNPVACRLLRMMTLGENVSLTLAPLHAPAMPLALSVSAMVAARLGLENGQEFTVSLLRDGIHVFGAKR